MSNAASAQRSAGGAILSLRYSALGLVVLIWSITGFPLLASVFNFAGLPTTEASIFLRGAIAGIAIVLAVAALVFRRFRHSGLLMLFLLFWTMYLTRIGHDILYASQFLGRPSYFYWSFAVGTCFLPALALATQWKINCDAMYSWLLVSGGGALVLALVAGDTIVESTTGGTYDSGRLALESLNPISLGHVAVTVLLAVYWRMRFRRHGVLTSPIALALALVSLWVMLAAGSRGPMVALIFGLLFFEAVKGWRTLVMLAIAASPLLALLSVDLVELDRTLGVTMFSRIEAGLSGSDAASSRRLVQIESAWQIFLAQPAFGGALEDSAFAIWPHNIFVEALMAVGLFGGTLLILICTLTLYLALKLARVSPHHALLGGLFVQYLVAAQFSGSLWGNNTFWVLMGSVIGVGDLSRKHRNVTSRVS